EGDGPVRAWTQQDARFDGAEASLDWTFFENRTGAWALRVFGDVVKAELDGSGSRDMKVAVPHGDHAHHYEVSLPNSGNPPRIARARVGGELRCERAAGRPSVGAIRYAEQDDVADYETVPPGYTLVDAHLAGHLDTPGGNAVEVFVD